MGKLADVQMGLEHAFDHSTRKGKWSTPGEVKRFSDEANLARLRSLVKQGAAKEKMAQGVPLKLFKPTRAGGGEEVLGLPKGKGPGSHRLGRPTGKYQGKKPGRRSGEKTKDNNWGKPDYNKKTKPGKISQDNLRNTIGTGIGIMLVGGMGSSGGASSTASAAARPSYMM